jgi:hypothetical protein
MVVVVVVVFFWVFFGCFFFFFFSQQTVKDNKIFHSSPNSFNGEVIVVVFFFLLPSPTFLDRTLRCCLLRVPRSATRQPQVPTIVKKEQFAVYNAAAVAIMASQYGRFLVVPSFCPKKWLRLILFLLIF